MHTPELVSNTTTFFQGTSKEASRIERFCKSEEEKRPKVCFITHIKIVILASGIPNFFAHAQSSSFLSLLPPEKNSFSF